MHVFEIVGNEKHPVYQQLSIQSLLRQYDFLRSIVDASVALQRPALSVELLKALNFHAISCLHAYAGQLRPCEVTVGNHIPPQHHRVPGLLDMFVDEVNVAFHQADPVFLASYVLWKLNHIHPFVNGNGRTARAACYYILCMKAGAWLPGDVILPELIRRERTSYVEALRVADASLGAGQLDLTQLHALLQTLLEEQLPASPAEPEEPNDQPA